MCLLFLSALRFSVCLWFRLFDCNVPRCDFSLYLSYLVSQHFSKLWLHANFQFWKILRHYLFKYCFSPIPFILPFWGTNYIRFRPFHHVLYAFHAVFCTFQLLFYPFFSLAYFLLYFSILISLFSCVSSSVKVLCGLLVSVILFFQNFHLFLFQNFHLFIHFSFILFS